LEKKEMTDEEVLAFMKLKSDGMIKEGIIKRLDEMF
jgi:hypothetical protein